MRLTANKDKGKGKGKADKIVQRCVASPLALQCQMLTPISGLNKVYTNGTLVDAELLIDEEAGHCVSIREEEGEDGISSFGISVLDSATSEFNLSAFEDDVCRTKLETLVRQIRPKEMVFTKVSCNPLSGQGVLTQMAQGNLSVATTRLLKAILPDGCLWTSLRDSEGFRYEQTLKELATLYPAEEESMQDEDDVVGGAVPDAIRDMYACRPAIEALGSMIW